MNLKVLVINFLLLPSKFLNFLKLKFRNVEYLKYPDIKGDIIIIGNGKIRLGDNVKINSSFTINPVGLSNKTAFYTIKDSQILIGKNVGISNSLLYSMIKIEIQDDVLIGGGCQILDNDFHPIDYEKRILNDDSYIRKRPVLIKKGAFIGASCIILKGVTIGENSVVGAGSVISKDIPDGEIWAGNPAVFVKKI